MKRKWKIGIAALCTAVLLTGLYAAATGGSSSDPLITLSYLKNIFAGEVEQMVDDAVAEGAEQNRVDMEAAIDAWDEQVNQAIDSVLGSTQTESPASFFPCALGSGSAVSLEAGSEIVVVSGEPLCSIDLVDQTDGSVLKAGQALSANHLYIAPEACTITAPEEVTVVQKMTGVVNTAALNVRSGPGSGYDRVGQLSRNTTVTILETLDGWYKISTSRLTGYVSSDYITVKEVDSSVESGDAAYLLIRGNYTQGDNEPGVKPDITYTVTVVDENDSPISGVSVTIGAAVGTTNASGKVTARLPADTYTVTLAVPEGYTASAAAYQVTATSTALTIRLTKVVEKVDYTVTVVDEDGAPISGVSVTIGSIGGITNASGKVTARLPADTYTVTLTVPEGYTADSAAYQVTADSASLTIKLTKVVEKVDYTVTVVDEDGAPISGVAVKIGSVSGTTNTSGKVTVNLARGSYTVTVTPPEGYTSAGGASFTIPAGSTQLTVTLTADKEDDPPVTQMATVIAGPLNMRSGPGTGYSILKVIPKGAVITVLDSGSLWYKASYDGAVGYVHSVNVELNGPDDDPVTQTGTVNAGPLNVRSGPGTGYSKVGSLAKGAAVTILETNGSWYKISSGGITGYVSSVYVTLNDVQQTQTGKVNASALNVRSGPGTGYGKVGSLTRGAAVTVLEKTNGWYKITAGSVTGYVDATYIVLD